MYVKIAEYEENMTKHYLSKYLDIPFICYTKKKSFISKLKQSSRLHQNFS